MAGHLAAASSLPKIMPSRADDGWCAKNGQVARFAGQRIKLASSHSVPRSKDVTAMSQRGFTTEVFSTRANQCPLLLQWQHICSAQRSDAKGQQRKSRLSTSCRICRVASIAAFDIISSPSLEALRGDRAVVTPFARTRSRCVPQRGHLAVGRLSGWRNLIFIAHPVFVAGCSLKEPIERSSRWVRPAVYRFEGQRTIRVIPVLAR